MNLLQIEIAALIPTKAGCAVFLGNKRKVIHFFIDLHIGQTINDAILGNDTERPMTHDLFSATLKGFGGKMLKMIIHDYRDDIFYARVYWEMENEVMERKLLEIDARPSDAMALAVRQNAPILISKKVWKEAENMKELLNDLKNQDEGEIM